MHANSFVAPYLFSEIPVDPAHKRRAIWFFIFSSLIFLAIAPFAKIQLAVIPAFIPLYQSALIVIDVVTTALIVAQLRSSLSQRLGWLAYGYLFTALLTIAHTLSFPGLFSPTGLLGANTQSTAWLYAFWHGAFPLFIIAYAVLPERRLTRKSIFAGVFGVIVLSAALTMLATKGAGFLPTVMRGNGYTPIQIIVFISVWLFSLLAIIVLVRKRPYTLLDLWLSVVLTVWIFDIALAAVLNGGRFDLGFYAGRIYGLIASLTVLYALLVETGSVYLKLVTSTTENIINRERMANQQLLNLVLTQLPEAVIIHTKKDNSFIANEKARAILGIEKKENGSGQSILFSIEKLYNLDLSSLPHIRTLINRTLAGSSFRNEEVSLPTELSSRQLAVSGSCVRDEANCIIASAIILQDVTEKREIETKLQHSLAQTRYFVENTPLAVIEWNKDLQVTNWNPRASQLFGWTSEEIIGGRLDCLPIIHEDDRKTVVNLISQIAIPRSTCGISTHINRTKDGCIRYTEWYNSFLHDQSGKFIAAFSLVLDVTEQKKAVEDLKEMDRRKDVYLATLAHELRNPLSPILNAATLMKVAPLSQDRLEKTAAIIHRQATQMNLLLDDLLDIARIKSGKMKLNMNRLDLISVVRDALDMSRPLIERAKHKLIVEFPETALNVNADLMRLTQVFVNLINNAAKYTNPGGEIRVKATVDADSVTISVRDNGVGIEKNMLQHVFNPFAQLDSALHLAQGGLGIGLSLTKSIIDLHDGKIAVHSDGPGLGTEFSVSLRLASAKEFGDDDAPVSTRADAKSEKIFLVADDDIETAELIASALQNIGAQVKIAHDGASALKIFNEARIDIAILDLKMPYMSGLELASYFGKSNPKPYLISITGWEVDEDIRAALNSKFDNHLSKPLELVKIMEMIHSL